MSDELSDRVEKVRAIDDKIRKLMAKRQAIICGMVGSAYSWEDIEISIDGKVLNRTAVPDWRNSEDGVLALFEVEEHHKQVQDRVRNGRQPKPKRRFHL